MLGIGWSGGLWRERQHYIAAALSAYKTILLALLFYVDSVMKRTGRFVNPSSVGE